MDTMSALFVHLGVQSMCAKVRTTVRYHIRCWPCRDKPCQPCTLTPACTPYLVIDPTAQKDMQTTAIALHLLAVCALTPRHPRLSRLSLCMYTRTCNTTAYGLHSRAHQVYLSTSAYTHGYSYILVQEEDVVVLEAPEDHPEWMLGAEVTDDGRCDAAANGRVRVRARVRLRAGVFTGSATDVSGGQAAVSHRCG